MNPLYRSDERLAAIRLSCVAFVGLMALTGGCRNRTERAAAPAAVSAAEFGHAECAACGMIVREQPAPRGQVVHRDGTRKFFCSVGDMETYIDVPSPHGAVTHRFVEVQASGADPSVLAIEPHPWQPASDGHYVVGVTRPRVMGEPVLSFGHRTDAEAAARTYGGSVADWVGVKTAGKTGR